MELVVVKKSVVKSVEGGEQPESLATALDRGVPLFSDPIPRLLI